MTTTEFYSPGLDGVIAGETAISSVEHGNLLYRGYDIAELAEHASFEECAYLLLYGELPSRPQLDAFRATLDAERPLPDPVLAALRLIPPDADLMDALRTGVSLTGHFDPRGAAVHTSAPPPELLRAQATRVLAQVPTLIGTLVRRGAGQAPPAPQAGLSHAAQLFHLITGRRPEPLAERVLNLTLILYAEHEFNASTFAARVCTSTRSDLYSAVVAAIATLKGPLHGGANEQAIALINRFDSATAARQWVLDALARKELVMGFGHRVYKAGDHRARILERYVEELGRQRGDATRLAVYQAIKDVMREQKGLHPNLDFPCGLVYFLLDLPIATYTPIFVAARVSGWCAHILEQAGANRIIRPRSRYRGPGPRPYVPLAQR